MSDRNTLRDDESRWLASNALAFAVYDPRPVCLGHCVVMTRREVAHWFGATPEEQQAIMRLVDELRGLLDREFAPHGYRVAFDLGEVAGLMVDVLQVHVLPRYRSCDEQPAAEYSEPLAVGGEHDPFAQHIGPLLARATDVAIVAAFVQESGVEYLAASLLDALRRGCRVRIITGDYLNITQASALEDLYDLEQSSLIDRQDDEDNASGAVEARVIEVEKLHGRSQSFHPKSWRFESNNFGVAFVGSSNLSLSALSTGIEWNLRIERGFNPVAYRKVCEAFEELWPRARPLDREWLAEYARRAKHSRIALPPWELQGETLPPPPPPHEVQEEALKALALSRTKGRQRALVVLATGLGKTWLAAFDFEQLANELGRRPRLLFIAHRRELLRQAAKTYRRLLRDRGEHPTIGWFSEEKNELDADLVFASVLKLARPLCLAQLRQQVFDYVVVDEVHHATADSYRRILAALTSRFVLGLTATPERADTADVLGLFDDHLAYRADVARGIELGRLVPFHYFGLRDDIDYENIPWRNRRWDTEVLATAAQTEKRMRTMWQAWLEHPAARTLVFCVSIPHATYVRNWLRLQGLRVAAVFSGDGSDDRDKALALIQQGELDAICAVDIFNEGVDLPALDRVVMLRPTESSVVFLQQLGRGLRAHANKSGLIVIDFVGNHRIFLERIRNLLSLGAGHESPDLQSFLSEAQSTELPSGCSVDVALEAKQLLQRLFRAGGADEVERAYRELRDARGERPRAGEMQRMGYLPRTLSKRHGSWFEFVQTERDLQDDQNRLLEHALGFLREIELAEVKDIFRFVALEALLEADALTSGLSVQELATLSHAIHQRSPELWASASEAERFSTLDDSNMTTWLEYWQGKAIEPWVMPARGGRAWFVRSNDRFAAKLDIPAALSDVASAMTLELVDYRIAQRRLPVTSDGFVCKVMSNARDPILKLPDRRSQQLPFGETDVRLRNGAVWQFRFMKEFINVARPPGLSRNQLPDLMREWFGPRAGQPGTAFEVRFQSSPDGLWVEPVHGSITVLEPRRGIPWYPDLRAAAGHAEQATEHLDAESVLLPVASNDSRLFAVRVSGHSMDGGQTPLRDGDWAVMRLSRGEPADALINRVVLAEVADESFGARYQIKRLTRSDNRWLLTSDNPDGPTIEPDEDVVAIARLEKAFRPEDLAPALGSRLAEDELPGGFGLPELTARTGRYGGHLFIFVDSPGILEAPNRLRYVAEQRRPSETAFVLARRDSAFRYLGVGKAIDDGSYWSIPDVDFETWRSWGEGKAVSRELPHGMLSRAQAAVDALFQLSEGDRVIEQPDGKRARILGRSQSGGVRLDGGEGGFSERSISLPDIAWVIAAQLDVAALGGLLDEERVNKIRYLEGTPKASTRFIDTGWALAIWERTRDLIPEVEVSALQRVHRDDGTEIDASFLIEKRGAMLSVLLEARGGKTGAPDARNTQYAEGLETILRRLMQLNAQIGDAWVESRETSALSLDEKRIEIPDAAYPIEISNPAELRRKMAGAAARVARAPGAKGGGNQTRRVRLLLSGASQSLDQLATLLSRGAPSQSTTRAR